MLYHPAKVPSLGLTLSLDSPRPYCVALITANLFIFSLDEGNSSEQEESSFSCCRRFFCCTCCSPVQPSSPHISDDENQIGLEPMVRSPEDNPEIPCKGLFKNFIDKPGLVGGT